MKTPSNDDMKLAAKWLIENESIQSEDACKRVSAWLLKLTEGKEFVVVPHDPTPEMINKGRNSVAQLSEQRFLLIWNATLAAHANQ